MKLKKTFRAMLLAETLNNVERETLGKEPAPFSLGTQQQIAYYLFAIYTTSNPDENMTYDEFIDRMDDPEFASELYAWMEADLNQAQKVFSKKKAKGRK